MLGNLAKSEDLYTRLQGQSGMSGSIIHASESKENCKVNYIALLEPAFALLLKVFFMTDFR